MHYYKFVFSEKQEIYYIGRSPINQYLFIVVHKAGSDSLSFWYYSQSVLYQVLYVNLKANALLLAIDLNKNKTYNTFNAYILL